MIQLDEKAYLYLLGLIPVLLLIYLAYQWWKKRAQRKFADSKMLRQLAPDRSYFKPQFKMILFLLVVVRFREFDEPIDGIVYASFIALGFAAVENVLYVPQLDSAEAYARGEAIGIGQPPLGRLLDRELIMTEKP